jgi:hypothetical protein
MQQGGSSKQEAVGELINSKALHSFFPIGKALHFEDNHIGTKTRLHLTL